MGDAIDVEDIPTRLSLKKISEMQQPSDVDGLDSTFLNQVNGKYKR
jgi:hypothetical protein